MKREEADLSSGKERWEGGREGKEEGRETGRMSIIGGLALAANLLSVLILLRWRDGDSNVRSVWLCSRNDAIGNAGVIAAAGVVALTGSPWPDLIVAALLSGLFLRSSWAITLQAIEELKTVKRNREIASEVTR